MSDRYTTGIDGLDAILGRGFVRGGGVSIRYQREGDADLLVLKLATDVVDELMSATVLPRASTTYDEVAQVLEYVGASLDVLLENDQAFFLDVGDTWGDRHNVFDVEEPEDVRAAVTTALERSTARGTGHLVEVESLVSAVGPGATRDLCDWYRSTLRGRRDLVMNFVRAPPLPDDLVSYYTDRHEQVVELVPDGDDVRLTVRKTPGGDPGASRRLEYLEEPPYVRLVD